jgi:hypothetical protein
MGFHPNYKEGSKSLGSVVGSSIEYFSKPHSFNTAAKNPPNIATLTGLSGPYTLPAGAKFIITMKYDGDNISGAEFTYTDKDAKDKHSWTIPVPPPVPPYPAPAIANAAVRTPIIAFQVDIVGASGGDTAAMKSGEGTITYTASTPMTVVAKKPSSQGDITAEKANSAYGELPVGPSKTFTQTFTVVTDTSK